MAHSVESRITTPGGELRELLDKAARQLPVLDAGMLADYLARLDRIDALFIELRANTVDTDPSLRAEEGRWMDLQQQLERRSAHLVKLAAQVGGFPALRQQNPGSDKLWWRLDEYVAAHRRQQRKRVLLAGVVVAVVLALAVLGYQTLLAPDAATLAQLQALSTIEQNVDAKAFEPAMAAAADALVAMPDDPELLAWATVLSERLGNQASAEDFAARTRASLAGNELQYQLLIGTNRFRAGDLEGATTAADRALLLSPDEPQVFFLYGNIAEARGDLNAALDAFDRAATLAEPDNPQLAVVSKMRYGFLIQQIQVAPAAGTASPEAAGASEATPLPTPAP